ncbi:MAG: hypothetical protein JXR37_01335 [Kiritimatiellae bacterium]|nr:hypothetical protein [Kiritimatiellia bacterium]
MSAMNDARIGASTGVKIVMGLPLVIVCALFLYVFFGVGMGLGLPDPWGRSAAALRMTLRLVLSVFWLSTLALYELYIFRTAAVPRVKRTLWGFMLVFGGFAATIVFYYQYILKRAKPMTPEATEGASIGTRTRTRT